MTYKDERGYERKHSNAVHRQRAYHHIYLKNRKKYPLPFSAYEVHHIDFDKTNNRMSNLAILTPEEHDKIHDEENLNQENNQDKVFAYKIKKRIAYENKILIGLTIAIIIALVLAIGFLPLFLLVIVIGFMILNTLNSKRKFKKIMRKGFKEITRNDEEFLHKYIDWSKL